MQNIIKINRSYFNEQSVLDCLKHEIVMEAIFVKCDGTITQESIHEGFERVRKDGYGDYVRDYRLYVLTISRDSDESGLLFETSYEASFTGFYEALEAFMHAKAFVSAVECYEYYAGEYPRINVALTTRDGYNLIANWDYDIPQEKFINLEDGPLFYDPEEENEE